MSLTVADLVVEKARIEGWDTILIGDISLGPAIDDMLVDIDRTDIEVVVSPLVPADHAYLANRALIKGLLKRAVHAVPLFEDFEE